MEPVISSNEREPLLERTTRNRAAITMDKKSGHIARLKLYLDGISVPLYLLIICFALSSWIDINGVWVEVPLLVNALPEGWNLPSYIIVIIQFANVGPLIYTILVRKWPRKVKEWPVVYIIITTGAVSCLALIFFWDFTADIKGTERSIGLLTFTFFLALVDCTSSVVYLPYMAILKPEYMTSFYIGEGLSGLIPGIVGLIQGVGGDAKCINTSSIFHNETTGENETIWELIPDYTEPNFSIEVFFFILFLMILISGFAFTLIHFTSIGKKERVQSSIVFDVKAAMQQEQHIEGSNNVVVRRISGTVESSVPEEQDVKEDLAQDEVENHMSYYKSVEETDHSIVALTKSEKSKPSLSRSEFIYLLILTAWISGLSNGLLPSTQSYSCLPYGGLAYTLSVRVSTLANPLACFIALFIPVLSVHKVSVLTFIGTVLAAYQMVLAAMSPSPPMQDVVVGEILVVVTSVLLVALFTYSKLNIACILREEGGRTALIWCGAVTQIGSFIGAIIAFVIVNVLKLFESMPPCPT